VSTYSACYFLLYLLLYLLLQLLLFQKLHSRLEEINALASGILNNFDYCIISATENA